MTDEHRANIADEITEIVVHAAIHTFALDGADLSDVLRLVSLNCLRMANA